MQIDLGAIALQAVNCCLDQIKNSCAPIATGCAKSKCVWKWTPDTTTKCKSICSYTWDPSVGKIWASDIICPNRDVCSCPYRASQLGEPADPNAISRRAFDCVPSGGTWSLENNCFTCCKCPQLTPPPKPTDPTKAQEISYDCEYNCECSKCSYVWIPPTTTKCTNTGPCQLYWDATAQQYILGYKGDGSSTFDPCNSQCPCSLWGTTPDEPGISRLIAGECTPITSEGGWKFNSSCNYPCQCDLAAPVEPPSDPTKSEKIYGACRVCDCIPCTCEYTWIPTVPCKTGICTLYWNADTNQYSATTPDGTSTSNPCTATCPCSLFGSSPPPGTPSMLISGECTQPTPNPCAESFCSYNWSVSNRKWEIGLGCSIVGCTCPAAPNPPADESKFVNIQLTCLDTAPSPSPSPGGCPAGTPCEWKCVTLFPGNPPVWIVYNSGNCPTCLPPTGLCQVGNENSFGCGKCLIQNTTSSSISNATSLTSSGFWTQTRSCSSTCICPETPTLAPADPTVSSSKTYTCAKNLCGQCGWTWQTDGHVWAPSSSCNSGCLCPISMPTWQPSNPDAGNTSVVAPCVPDTCATSKCDYDWTYSYVLEKWQFLLIKNCPNGCECSPSIPLEPPTNPDSSPIVSFDCKSKSTTPTSTTPPPTTPPPVTCTDPTKPCLWFCTPPADGIGPPQWVYSGGAEQCPSKTCLPPTYLCQVGNENTYGCGPCLPSACDAGCTVECFGGNVTSVTGCAGSNCTCYYPFTGETPQLFCNRTTGPNTGGTVQFLCKSSQSSTTPPPNICIFGACTLDCKNGVVVYLGENNNCGGCVCGGDTLGPGGSYRTPQMICKTIGNGTVDVKCVSYS